MMAGAEVSARRQSIVKRDGTVDAATLAANERLSKMVAMQAGRSAALPTSAPPAPSTAA